MTEDSQSSTSTPSNGGYSSTTPVEQRGWGHTLIFLSLLTLLASVLLYFTRRHWLPALQEMMDKLFRRNENYSFIHDAEQGMSSQNFNLAGNITSDDSRSLDASATREIKKMMKRHNLSFDEARQRYITSRFSQHGIGADGMPTDPKALVFSSTSR